ncbi:acetyltransferase (GNAT) family protein [Humitalea rosea]|uniref:Acetyltransferase (GNAT) family protein n=1 Tax=Humitalea rosea TaxID=990373 RepID=A0A2W7KGB4_9PROT|nr:GNAT family N-acetyltransferase [Humitalea rosea]PZW46769.1 acetyltransferase (GNAT) family protein [Humitalea rosea]
MRFATDPAARLIPLARSCLPAWCDAYLAAGDSGDFFAGRVWYDSILAHALPVGSEPVLAVCGRSDAVLLPLLRQGSRLRSLVTPYTLSWRPLNAAGAGPGTLRAAGRGLARLLRRRGPTLLEALADDTPGLEAILEGVASAGLALGRYRHFGNWREALPPGLSWSGYLAARPPVLRTTILRKLARAGREMRFSLMTAPGPALEAGIAAYVAVRDRSWKPAEPFPDFDAALMRAAAAAGLLRLGVLRDREERPVAAQYWVVSGGRAALLKLAHDEAQRAASPGTALTALMIRGLIDDVGVAELDFGRGDDPYKAQWVTQRRQRIGVALTDPWHPAGMLELARQTMGQGRRRIAGWLQSVEGCA